MKSSHLPQSDFIFGFFLFIYLFIYFLIVMALKLSERRGPNFNQGIALKAAVDQTLSTVDSVTFNFNFSLYFLLFNFFKRLVPLKYPYSWWHHESIRQRGSCALWCGWEQKRTIILPGWINKVSKKNFNSTTCPWQDCL